jgi:replication-associated recombination protein RarA
MHEIIGIAWESVGMNDPEVMERIAAALELIAWILSGKE